MAALQAEAGVPKARTRSTRSLVLMALAGVLVLDVLAAVFLPPFPKGNPTGAFQFPSDGIIANLELPAPHVVWDLAPNDGNDPGALLQFHPSISSTILTSWIVIGIILVLILLATRKLTMIPGRVQNALELGYESMLDFGTSLGGPAARPYLPFFAAFFIYILFSNWSGLIPPVGKIEELRAPTSDVNITIGLALCSFILFHVEGFRHLGPVGYLSKFFPLGEFRKGIGAGILALFVGLIELLLEFVKPLTLSMRLFGNIFGGEVALGVMTALTIAVVPVAIIGLEFLLNLIQALIFSVLTLMFTLAAIEGHHTEGTPGHELEPIALPMADPTFELEKPSAQPAH